MKLQSKAAFSLVEVAIAVGVASFCLITILALIPAGVSANQTSVEQTEATGLMAGVVADLRSTHVPTSATDPTYGTSSIPSPRYQILIPRANATTSSQVSFFLTEDGSLSGTLNANAVPADNPHYRVTLNFYPPLAVTALSGTSSLAATRVRVLVTWPALADSVVANLPSNFSGSVETVVQLNRNWQDY